MKSEIIQCCSNLETLPTQETGFVTTGIKNILQNPSFEYWLNLFAKIMPHVEILFHQMQSRQIKAVFARNYVKNFEIQINKIRNNIGVANNQSSSSLPEVEHQRTQETRFDVEAKEACDVVLMQCQVRFKFSGHLIAARLVEEFSYATFVKEFPQLVLDDVIEFYPHLSKEKLKTELTVFYERDDLNKFAKLTDLIKRIYDLDLQLVFSELLKLLKILVVTPMTTSEAERCFSTLRRIKYFLRSTTGNERLSALAMLSIEKNMVAEMKDFNAKVIEHFSTAKKRRMDFIFK